MATKKNLRGLYYLRILLVGGMLSEICVDFIDYAYQSRYSNLVYLVYLPFEFSMLSMFMIKSTNRYLFKALIISSIPVYVAFFAYYSIFHFSMSLYPGAIYNVGCFFIICWAVLLFFNLEIDENFRLTQLPFFWIGSAIIILYMGVFFYNAVYNYFMNEKTEFAVALRSIINMNLNYIFYLLLSYAFICSIRLKKYSIQ